MSAALRAVLAVAIAGSALAAGGCGSGDGGGTAPASGSRTLTVYSSLPLHGPARRQSQDMVNGMKLALQQAGGKVGPLNVNYVSLDSAPADAQKWTPDQVLNNARKALRDANTIAYIGDADSAATALSLPLTNEGGFLQVSPSSSYAGLTRTGTPARGDPERFYPSGLRTFARMVPADEIQAAALVGYMQSEGVQHLYLVHERDLSGEGLAEQVTQLAGREDLDIVGNDDIDSDNNNVSGLINRVSRSEADAFLFAGGINAHAARVFSAVGAADPGLLLFGDDTVADSAFTEALPAAVQRRMRITSPALDLRVLPAAARRWRDTFRRTFGRDPEPEAIYAYEAMAATLQAIRDAGSEGNNRSAVIGAFLGMRRTHTVLGTYTINDAGDTSQSRYGSYRVRNGELVFDKVLQVGR
jgi:branched-chain amino acid transport system substrate-binding protein